MSHEITATDHMAYIGQTPWHGLGTQLKPGASVQEMLEAAKLTWGIGLAGLQYRVTPLDEAAALAAFTTASLHASKVSKKSRAEADAIGMKAAIDFIAGSKKPTNCKAMFRDDTGDLLDIVGPQYVPAQNEEVLDFFKQYVATGDMTLETAGSLKGGKYVWGQAKLAASFKLAGGDEVRGYLLIANPNIYGKGMIVKFVLERVVCWNTITVALNEGGQQIVLWHNRKFDTEARKDAATKIGLATDTLESMKVEAQKFAKFQLEEKAIDRVLASTFKVELKEEVLVENRTTRRVKELFSGAAIGADMPSAKGTAWGLLNAVTQFTDHEYARTKTKNNADGRLERSWFGQGERIKRAARQGLWQEVGK